MKYKNRKTIVLAFGVPLGIILVLIIIFLLYSANVYTADETALAILEQGDGVSEQDGMVILSPETKSNTGIIFYPGGLVEYTAYLPLLDSLRQNNLTCVVLQMPLNYAIFDTDAALNTMQNMPEIEHWYLAGHSLGGISAGIFAEEFPESIDGLIVLGAYVYGDYPPQNALTVYGTLNANLEDSIDYTENIVMIDGGNHAQFGNYGKQRGDEDATITAQEQQDITVQAILDFIAQK